MGTTTTLVTVQEFLALPEQEDTRVELVGGEIVDMGQGGQPHEFVKSNINKLLLAWLLQNHPGRVLIESGFRIDKYNFLIPDLSYLQDPPKRASKGHFQRAPDLAIEIVSSEPAARLSKKIGLYLSHGGKSVWAIYPEEQKISIHAPGGSKEFQRGDILKDPKVLPGFSAPVSAIFEGI